MKPNLPCTTAVLMVIALAGKPAFASTWVLAGKDNIRTQYVDTSSIVLDGANVKVWTRSVFAAPQVSNGRTYLVELVHNVYACDRRVATPLGDRRFAALDQAVLIEGSDFGDVPPGWDDLTPNTVQEEIRTRVCKPATNPK